MTPLRPIDAMQSVRGVMADRYPRNEVCAHPECDKPTESVHHIFGRPPGPNSDSWFVNLPYGDARATIPHAIGLCGSGTAGHHGDLEEHRAWIKLEDGEFIWYDRLGAEETLAERERWSEATGEHPDSYPTDDDVWKILGPLDPQPAGRVKARPKPKKQRKSGEDRAKRTRMTIGAPADTERPGEIWDDLFGSGKGEIPLGRVRERMGRLRDEPDGVDHRPEFELIVDMAWDWING